MRSKWKVVRHTPKTSASKSEVASSSSSSKLPPQRLSSRQQILREKWLQFKVLPSFETESDCTKTKRERLCWPRDDDVELVNLLKHLDPNFGGPFALCCFLFLLTWKLIHLEYCDDVQNCAAPWNTTNPPQVKNQHHCFSHISLLIKGAIKIP